MKRTGQVAKNMRVVSEKDNEGRLTQLPVLSWERSVREISHRGPSTSCAIGVVYEAPLARGFSDVEQSGRCLNAQMIQHERSVKNKATYSQLVRHVCSNCKNCEPQCDNVIVLGRERVPEKKVYSRKFTSIDYDQLC